MQTESGGGAAGHKSCVPGQDATRRKSSNPVKSSCRGGAAVQRTLHLVRDADVFSSCTLSSAFDLQLVAPSRAEAMRLDC